MLPKRSFELLILHFSMLNCRQPIRITKSQGVIMHIHIEIWAINKTCRIRCQPPTCLWIINTLKSWARRYNSKGKKGLFDQRKGPNHIPNKISKEMEERIVSIRKRTKCFGPKRIKYFYDIPCSLGAIQRVIRSHKLTRKRRTVTKKRRDLRAVKAKRQSMAHLQIDIKYLTDIPNYWQQIPLGLPKYQYTVRETKTGMFF